MGYARDDKLRLLENIINKDLNSDKEDAQEQNALFSYYNDYVGFAQPIRTVLRVLPPSHHLRTHHSPRHRPPPPKNPRSESPSSVLPDTINQAPSPD